MKSELKQTAETNFLVDKLDSQFSQLKKALPLIIGGLLIVFVSAWAYGYYLTQKEQQSARGWTALYFGDTDPQELNAVAADYPGTSAALWAKQTAGDALLARAIDKVYLDRDVSEQYYKQAIDEYKSVAEKATDPFLKSRAILGYAQALEGISEREQAIAEYKKIAATSGINADFVAEATKRVAWLESKAGEEFFAWFSSFRPTAPVLNDPAIKTPSIPGLPDFNFPAVPSAGNIIPAVPESSAPSIVPTSDAKVETTVPEPSSTDTSSVSDTSSSTEPASDSQPKQP